MSDLEDRVAEVVDLISDFGAFDGAHHKDWVLQQALRILMGWDERELFDWLDRSEWEKGIPP